MLLTDDAPQFKQITNLLALCWVHDGRHYKKLEPVIPYHREQLNAFLDRYWDYYRKLLAFKAAPNETLATSLSSEFEALFTTKTGYEQLDDRIEKTRLKQPSLLLVLRYPELPLHNNTSELAARRQACYRDSSQHTMNKAGTEAKDTFMTLVATAKKLAVNSYHYFYDRLTQKYEMPSLADLIKMNSQGFVFSSA
ncbi:MAG: transposase [Gammaproteobacteria bacterium]|nr:transposase [Gammaproteobacteria bacterium]